MISQLNSDLLWFVFLNCDPHCSPLEEVVLAADVVRVKASLNHRESQSTGKVESGLKGRSATFTPAVGTFALSTHGRTCDDVGHLEENIQKSLDFNADHQRRTYIDVEQRSVYYCAFIRGRLFLF